jgi:hypothetical protein
LTFSFSFLWPCIFLKTWIALSVAAGALVTRRTP